MNAMLSDEVISTLFSQVDVNTAIILRICCHQYYKISNVAYDNFWKYVFEYRVEHSYSLLYRVDTMDIFRVALKHNDILYVSKLIIENNITTSIIINDVGDDISPEILNIILELIKVELNTVEDIHRQDYLYRICSTGNESLLSGIYKYFNNKDLEFITWNKEIFMRKFACSGNLRLFQSVYNNFPKIFPLEELNESELSKILYEISHAGGIDWYSTILGVCLQFNDVESAEIIYRIKPYDINFDWHHVRRQLDNVTYKTFIWIQNHYQPLIKMIISDDLEVMKCLYEQEKSKIPDKILSNAILNYKYNTVEWCLSVQTTWNWCNVISLLFRNENITIANLKYCFSIVPDGVMVDNLPEKISPLPTIRSSDEFEYDNVVRRSDTNINRHRSHPRRSNTVSSRSNIRGDEINDDTTINIEDNVVLERYYQSNDDTIINIEDYTQDNVVLERYNRHKTNEIADNTYENWDNNTGAIIRNSTIYENYDNESPNIYPHMDKITYKELIQKSLRCNKPLVLEYVILFISKKTLLNWNEIYVLINVCRGNNNIMINCLRELDMHYNMGNCGERWKYDRYF